MKSGATKIALRNKGFTLLELLVTVVIIGIISGIAISSYRTQVTKTRRTDATTALLEIANREEKFYATCNTYSNNLTAAMPTSYAGCTGAGLGYRATSNNGYYNLVPSAGSTGSFASSFLITASPVSTGPQVGDGSFTLNSIGQRQYDANHNGTFESSETKWP